MKMKVLTKRKQIKPDPIKEATILQRTMNRLRKMALVPRGVYRFKNFKEANEWMMKAMINTHARQKSKT